MKDILPPTLAKKPFFLGLQMNDDTLQTTHAVDKLDMAAINMLV